MTKTCDRRSRWEKVRDNIYSDIMETKGMHPDYAKLEANRQTNELFAQIVDKGIDITNKRIDVSKQAGDDSMSAHIRLDVDEYTLEFGGGKFVAHRHGRTWRDLTGDNLILALMTRIIELQRIIASHRSDEAEPTAEEWAQTEQRAGEAKMDDTFNGSKS